MIVLIGLPLQRKYDAEMRRLQDNPLFPKVLRPSRLELHVTLKAPQEIDDAAIWIDEVSQKLKGATAATAKVTRIDFINSTSLVVFLDHQDLQRLHDPLIGDTPEFYEGEGFDPHITIGRASHPVTPEVKRQAAELYKNDPLTGSEIEFRIVRLYGRETRNDRYRALKDIELSGSY